MNVLMTALHPGGGIKTFFRYVYSQPCFEHYKFSLIAPDDEGQLSDYVDAYLGGDRFEVLPSSPGSLGFIRKVRAALHTSQVDLIHSHGFGAGLLTQLATSGLKCSRHLMTAHDVFLDSQFIGWGGFVRKAAMSRIFCRISMIHTVTRDANDNFKKFFPRVSETRLRPILHGVDTELFLSGKPRDLREQLGISEEIPLIGFFGRFMGQKGFRTLVHSLQILKNKDYKPMPVVLTFGWGGFIREDYDYISELGLGECFVQMPATDDMPGMIKSVDMVVMPSRWEACGLLGMEVLAAGVPLLSTDCIGLREVIADSPAKIFSPGDSEGLAQLIENEIACSSKGDFVNYQETAIKRFHIARPAMKIKGLYDELVGV